MKKNRFVTISVIAIVIIILAIIIYFIIKKNIGKIKEKSLDNKYFKDVENQIDASEITLSNSNLVDLANKLEIAMKGFGTDENEVQDVFNNINNKSELLKLISTFGTRNGENLTEWIAGDFSTKAKEKYINSILRNKNIDYQF